MQTRTSKKKDLSDYIH